MNILKKVGLAAAPAVLALGLVGAEAGPTLSDSAYKCDCGPGCYELVWEAT